MTITDKMLRYSPDMFCCVNRQGYFVKVSGACHKIIGYAPQELEGKSFVDFVIPEHKAKSMALVEQALSGEDLPAFENCYFAKDGQTIPLRWTAQWVEEEELMFCTARNATELVKGRKLLAESIEKYKALFENSPDVIFLEDATGAVTEVNQAFCRIFGLKQEEVIGKPSSTFLSPEMASVNQMSFKEAMAGSTLRFDVYCQSSENESLTFDAVKFPVIVHGKIIGAQTIAKDITPIVRSFDTITRQAQKLNNILESITDAFIMLDPEWNITMVNSTSECFLGLKRQNLLGKNIWEVFPAEVGGEFYRQYQHAVTTKKAVHFTSYFQEGDMWLEVKAYPSKEGLSVYYDNVTEKVKAEQELEKLSLVASRTDNGVVITDAAGKTEWVNEGFTRMTGYTLPEIIGKKPGELLQGAETDKETVKEIQGNLKRGAHFTARLVNYTKAGEKIWVSMDITPIQNEAGAIVQYIAIQRDVTYRQEAEARQLQMTQDLYRQNKALQQFTYIVSHNLRAPVANALGLADLLTKTDRHSDAFSYALFSLKKSVVQMDTVLRDVNMILSVREKQDVLAQEQVALLDVFRQACTHLQEALISCDANLKVEIPEKLTVTANYAYLYSIFYNLLSNALKFRAEDRQLLIKVKATKKHKGVTVICFADNGIGFDLAKAGEDVFKLYKKFHTKQKTGGRGIGLFLVKTHVEAMGGKIEVNSQFNKGTEFLIYLP